MKFFRISMVLILMLSGIMAKAQRQMEKLDHGLVAVKTSSGAFISWRVLGSEMDAMMYNLYRNGVKVNDEPIDGASNYTDVNGDLNSVYELRTVFNGAEHVINETATVWEHNYIDIPVDPIEGSYSTHILNDASVGDLDGDGQYEIVVKRLAVDKAVESTDYHYLEAYELDGTKLWSINIGPNIYDDVEFNFLVWDLDGDGKAEVATRTSEGTIDGLGNQIGDVDKDGITNYRNYIASGYRYKGPDFLSVFDGMTGEELTRQNYIEREPISQWGLPGQNTGQYAHRATKCMFTVAYLDGKNPSVVISRGIYEKIAMEAWDFRNGELTRIWHFDSDQAGNSSYAKQGNHNLSQADVDNDGRDEIMYGGMCINDDGTGLYSTELGHGDAAHLADINPDRKGLEYFRCLENSTGGNYQDAGTGDIFFYKSIGRDMGRAGCSDITASFPGMEMWGPSGFPFLSATGEEITYLTPPSSMNFFIWWDGDPLREMLDHAWVEPNGTGTITKYDNGQNTRLLTATGTLSNNWTKGTPAVSADILGDWREEVIWRTTDNKALRLYISTYPTDIRIYTLMHDPQYRAAIGWQPNSYNQPPHTSFFIGDDMDSVPPSPSMLPGQKAWKNGTWDVGTTPAWDDMGNTVMFENGDSVLFDISGNNSAEIMLDGSLQPADVRVISPGNYVFSGNGSIDGNTNLTKDGEGKLTINTMNYFTGITRIWDGEFYLNGTLENSPVLVKRFAVAGGSGRFNSGLKLEKFAGLIVSGTIGQTDTLFVKKDLYLANGSSVYMDLSDDPSGLSKTNDIIVVDGDLSVEGELTLQVTTPDGQLSIGKYILMSATGNLSATIDKITVLGLSGTAFTMALENNQLVLEVPETRPPTTVIWTGAVDNKWDIFNKLNWINDGNPDVFIGNDTVIFNDQAIQTVIEIMGIYSVGQFQFESSKNMMIMGDGYFTGSANLLKKGTGNLILSTLNDYTGITSIEEGILRIPEIKNAGVPSGIGSATGDPGNLVLNGGTLELTNSGNIATDRGITIGAGNGGLRISSSGGSYTFNSPITGSGYLVKDGAGTIILKSNSMKGTIIKAGTVQLGDEDANYYGPGEEVIFEGGTLAMYDNYNSYTDNCGWDLFVDQGEHGTIRLDGRSSISGSLTGSGILNVYVPWIRNEVRGNWTGFTGTINVSTDSDGGSFIVGNTSGMDKAAVYLGENVTALYANSSDVTIPIGELTGHSGSYLGAGGLASNTITWKIGGKNTNAEFNGVINNAQIKNSGSKAAIIKTGTGRWTLTGANTYSGSTTVEQGTLILNNTSGSATGTGNITCQDGAYLAGDGSVSGTASIASGGTLLPGYSMIGSLNIGGQLRFYENSVYMVDVDISTGQSDITNVSGNITLDGILQITNLSTEDYSEGNSFQIFSAGGTITGTFTNIIPKTPGPDLRWNTSELTTSGILKVDKATGTEDRSFTTSLQVYPNPFKKEVYVTTGVSLDVENLQVYTISGKELNPEIQKVSENRFKINMSGYPSGKYLIKLNQGNSEIVTSIILKTE